MTQLRQSTAIHAYGHHALQERIKKLRMLSYAPNLNVNVIELSQPVCSAVRFRLPMSVGISSLTPALYLLYAVSSLLPLFITYI